VSFLAFITALTFPVFSSITTVLAGSPSPPAEGTETILHPVPPASPTRDGMNSMVISGLRTVRRCGIWMSGTSLFARQTGGGGLEKEVKTEDCEARASSGSREESTESTSDEDRMVRLDTELGAGFLTIMAGSRRYSSPTFPTLPRR
jgi:hypothetical protein